MLRIDYHLHSSLSVGGRSSVVALCRRAVALGFSAVAFTEDVRFEPPDGAPCHPDDRDHLRQINRAREEFGDRIRIAMGVEIDFQARYRERIARFVAEREFDYVLGAVHKVEGESVESDCFLARRTAWEAYRDYFAEVTRAAESGLFDAIAHVDLVKRRAREFYGPPQGEALRGILERMLSAMVERGTALEVNSSGLRTPAREVYPSQEILKLYRELGGDAVVVGSDAREAEELGFGVEQAAAMLRDEGFESLTLYESRRPYKVPLA